MKKDEPKPEPKSSGNMTPPRPSKRTAIGVGPDGEDSDKKFHATITMVANGEGKFILEQAVGAITVT